MENNEMLFTVLDDEGNEVQCEVLFTFEMGGTDYIVYTNNELDEEGNTKVFANIYDPDAEEQQLLPVETEEEWRMIEAMLQQLQEEADED